jgi:thiamine-phosphate pyrophosphorylase
VSFGPIGSTGLGDGSHAEREIFEWWSEVIEVPIVAEGGLDAEHVASLAPVTDFLAFGEEIWREDDAAAALGRLISAIG